MASVANKETGQVRRTRSPMHFILNAVAVWELLEQLGISRTHWRGWSVFLPSACPI